MCRVSGYRVRSKRPGGCMVYRSVQCGLQLSTRSPITSMIRHGSSPPSEVRADITPLRPERPDPADRADRADRMDCPVSGRPGGGAGPVGGPPVTVPPYSYAPRIGFCKLSKIDPSYVINPRVKSPISIAPLSARSTAVRNASASSLVQLILNLSKACFRSSREMNPSPSMSSFLNSLEGFNFPPFDTSTRSTASFTISIQYRACQ
mmetsp:Transcript_23285/g.59814  ORF Transcript_23285/g.59814 Transcript_23285/m.59814 type:complete len:206 (+) Transcript_23285:352-969(+)